MNKPDPLRHMMLWGASSSGLVLLLYFLLTGSLSLAGNEPFVFVLLIAGIFTGFTLGGMSAVIIGTAFQHEQIAIDTEKIHNRRKIILITVFIMVMLMSRILIVMAFGFVDHPLILSLIGAIIASLASQHYLYRMENWLTTRKRKRKNDEIPSRLLDDNDEGFFQEEDSEGLASLDAKASSYEKPER